MYITFFLIFITVTLLCFAASILLPKQDDRLIFSIASLFLIAGSAYACFDVQLVDVVSSADALGYSVVTTDVYSSYLAFVFLILFIIALVNSINMVFYALRHPENPFNHSVNSGERYMDYHQK
jgi:UDP-N-acetylmuramyl pentapeptide phosphotransferase/UDP-N-acetylglucosamine-1-phosphate transferase